jgi:hypothetical protein
MTRMIVEFEDLSANRLGATDYINKKGHFRIDGYN